MVEDPKDSGSKKSAETLRLEQLEPIFLKNYREGIVVTSNPWPDDFDEAEKERKRLNTYMAIKELKDNRRLELLVDPSGFSDGEHDLKLTIEEAVEGLAKKSNLTPAQLINNCKNDPNELVRLFSYLEEGDSKMVFLYHVLREFGQDGLAIHCGISGKVFKIGEDISYDRSRDLLVENNIPITVSSLKEISKDESRLVLKNAADVCLDIGLSSQLLASKRYNSLANLFSLEGLVCVRGYTDRPSTPWPDVKENGICEYKLKNGDVLKIAYYGLPSVKDAPVDLVGSVYDSKKELGKLETFLKENNFDVFFFNGTTQLLEHAINNCNAKNRVTRGRFPFAKSEPKLKNKIFIVSNPKKHDTSIEAKIFNDKKYEYSNLFIEGVNYKDSKMLLIDPVSRNTIYFAVISEPKKLIRDRESVESVLNMESRVFEGYRYDTRRGGNPLKVDFARKEHVGEGSSALSTYSSSVINFFNMSREEVAKIPETVQIGTTPNPKPKREGCLSALVPWVLGGAVGAGAVWAYYENQIIPGFRKIYEEYKQIVKDLRSK